MDRKSKLMGAAGLVTVLAFTGAQVDAAFDGVLPNNWPETPDIVVFNSSTATDSGDIRQTTFNMVIGGEIEMVPNAAGVTIEWSKRPTDPSSAQALKSASEEPCSFEPSVFYIEPRVFTQIDTSLTDDLKST